MDAPPFNMLAAAGQVIAVFAAAFVLVCAVVIATCLTRARAAPQAAARAGGAAAAGPSDAEARAAELLEQARRSRTPFTVLVATDPPGGDAPPFRGADLAWRDAEGNWCAALPVPAETASRVVERLCRAWPGTAFGMSGFPDNPGNIAALKEKAVQSATCTVLELPADAAASRALPGGWKDVVMPQELDHALGRYWAVHEDDPRGLSLLRIDIDRCKIYSEQYGPRAGADIVQQLGALIRHNVRYNDLVAHARDDEFMVAMPAMPEQARVAAMRVLNVIRKTTFPFSGHDLKITVSIGIASAPVHGNSLDQLVQLSEAALGSAKARGRNTAVVYDAAAAPAGGDAQRDTL
jgi:diguanylate cyclase (GGDEF)-like protein